jgi:hypothetical protein
MSGRMKHTARVDVVTEATGGGVRGSALSERAVAFGSAGGPALACLVVALLHLPAFRYELISDDEAIYDAMGQVVSRGGVMYRDTVDHKPPGLVLIYASVRGVVEHFGGSFSDVLAGVHLLGLIAAVLTCTGLYGVARRVLPERLWALPPLLYALVSMSNQPPDSLAVNGELLMNLPTVLSVGCALAASIRKGPSSVALNVAAGALCGVAALFKYQAALVGVSFLFLLPGQNTKGLLKALLVRGSALAVGLALPFGCTATYFWEKGALSDAIAWGIEFNRHYLAEGPDAWTALTRFSLQFFGMVVPNIVVYGAGLWGLGSLIRWGRLGGNDVHGLAGTRWMLAVWAIESLFCVSLGRRFFGHYFLQPELPLALLAAAPVASLWAWRPRLVVTAIGLPVLIFFLVAALPRYTRKYVYTTDPDYWTVGRAAAMRTTPSESIWVWGNVPQIYYTAERMPGVRFTFCNYLTGLSPGTRSEYDPTVDPRRNAVPEAWRDLFLDLDSKRPTLVIDTAAAGMKSYGKFPIRSFPALEGDLRAHYRPDGVVNGVVFYRRADPT